MSSSVLILIVLGLGLVGWLVSRAKAASLATPGSRQLHSLPRYHGTYVALWAILPALMALALWSSVSPRLINSAVMSDPAAKTLPAEAIDRDAILSEAAQLARGDIEAGFNPASDALVPAFKVADAKFGMMGAALTLVVAFACGAFAFTRVKVGFKARTKVERVTMMVLLLASLMAVLTTFGIVASLIVESGRFFSAISPIDFLFGLHWNPTAEGGPDLGENFGAIPLFWGTIFIGAIIAMIVAIPLGLMSAIFLTQYADARLRAWVKPLLEILAGVPTVVYGYFAALTVAPLVRDLAVKLGMENPSTESALAAGLVMGVMIIPFVSSMADDSIAAVPQAMRDGSLAMGATTSETIKRVLVPAALPGIVAGVMLAISRAIGETMIVVMAAGAAANLSANPFASMTTVTFQIVALLTGDQDFNTPKTMSAFALGLVLFVVTLLLNIVALRVVKRFREAYD
ncbi:phosphate ABC transporter permease subunit PstC [Aquisediminimonas profunda]|uniref:phosphate ABC transporter permease subunit PstC n=1 Tax=Aquisediminimonas profunda TaxID=1550733 RepID=UPI001C62A83F|nr:phosphate ABC transporter permease subunit PstC [Aquisediminimonas profunda]